MNGKTAAAAEIRRGRKFDQVLEGARTVFLRDGYEGASVDDIAAEARVSKATLYSYFPDKRQLFLEIAKRECARQAEQAERLIVKSAPPEVVLPVAARRIADFVLSDFGRATYRACISESERFPELGREFYATGPGLVRERLTAYLEGAVARGELLIEDIPLAASQFAELCKAEIFPKLCFGVVDRVSEADRERVARAAVETFLARYAPRRPGPVSPVGG